MSIRSLLTLACAVMLTVSPVAAADSPVFTAHDRIVNLGDSITDGQTYALLTQAALAEAHQPVPTFIGAGVGGDVAAGMLARLDRDVLVHHPTWVMLNCGINDIGTKVKMADYEASVNAIAERLKKENVRLMILTTTDIRGGAEQNELDAVNTILNRIAEKHGLIVAKVYDRMEEARHKGLDLWEPDGCHLNFEGYRALTRAILDAMGYREVSVPTAFHPAVLPGIIKTWKVLTLNDNDPSLTEAGAAALKPDEKWKDLELPEASPQKNWWREQERARGFALSLKALFGGTRHLALAEITSEPRKVFINTGGDLKAVWLNGKKLPIEYHGWHAGSNRIPVELQSGANTLVVEAEDTFFVSLTDTNTW